jgi:hypothetical protein
MLYHVGVIVLIKGLIADASVRDNRSWHGGTPNLGREVPPPLRRTAAAGRARAEGLPPGCSCCQTAWISVALPLPAAVSLKGLVSSHGTGAGPRHPRRQVLRAARRAPRARRARRPPRLLRLRAQASLGRLQPGAPSPLSAPSRGRHSARRAATAAPPVLLRAGVPRVRAHSQMTEHGKRVCRGIVADPGADVSVAWDGCACCTLAAGTANIYACSVISRGRCLVDPLMG